MPSTHPDKVESASPTNPIRFPLLNGQSQHHETLRSLAVLRSRKLSGAKEISDAQVCEVRSSGSSRWSES